MCAGCDGVCSWGEHLHSCERSRIEQRKPLGCSGVPTELHPVLWQMLKLEWQCKIVCVGARSDFGPLYQPVFRCRQRQHFRQSDSSQHSVGTREQTVSCQKSAITLPAAEGVSAPTLQGGLEQCSTAVSTSRTPTSFYTQQSKALN